MIKENINKIHVDLINKFKSVNILEKSSIKFGKYFEISSVSEGMEVKMILTLNDLNSNNIKWSYFANPLDENSHLVERESNINNISNDVMDIITKKRFSDDYFWTTESQENDSKRDINWIFDFISKSTDDSYDFQCDIVDDKVVCKNSNYEISISDNGQPNNFFIVDIKKDGNVIQDSNTGETSVSFPADEIPSESVLILLARYFQNN